MDRRPEPELMNTKDQVDSYSEADFSKGEIKFIRLIKNHLKKNNYKGTKKPKIELSLVQRI